PGHPGPALRRYSLHRPATTRVQPLSLHDALPISRESVSWLRTRGPTSAEIRAIMARTTSISTRVKPPRRRRRGASLRTETTGRRSEEHTSELQSRENLVCRLLLEKKKPHRHSSAP